MTCRHRPADRDTVRAFPKKVPCVTDDDGRERINAPLPVSRQGGVALDWITPRSATRNAIGYASATLLTVMVAFGVVDASVPLMRT